MPYLPVSHAPALFLVAYPRKGGADITCQGVSVGKLYYSNLQWQPMHHKGLGANCVVAVTMGKDMVSKLFTIAEGTTTRCWRVKVLSRANDYGEWIEQNHRGTLELS